MGWNRPDVPVAKRRQRVGRHRRQVLFANPHAAAVGGIEPAGTCSGVLLPAAPTIATISFFDDEVEPTQDLQARRARGVALVDGVRLRNAIYW